MRRNIFVRICIIICPHSLKLKLISCCFNIVLEFPVKVFLNDSLGKLSTCRTLSSQFFNNPLLTFSLSLSLSLSLSPSHSLLLSVTFSFIQLNCEYAMVSSRFSLFFIFILGVAILAQQTWIPFINNSPTCRCNNCKM